MTSSSILVGRQIAPDVPDGFIARLPLVCPHGGAEENGEHDTRHHCAVCHGADDIRRHKVQQCLLERGFGDLCGSDIRAADDLDAQSRLDGEGKADGQDCRDDRKEKNPLKRVKPHFSRALPVAAADCAGDCRHDEDDDRHLDQADKDIADEFQIGTPRTDNCTKDDTADGGEQDLRRQRHRKLFHALRSFRWKYAALACGSSFLSLL